MKVAQLTRLGLPIVNKEELLIWMGPSSSDTVAFKLFANVLHSGILLAIAKSYGVMCSLKNLKIEVRHQTRNNSQINKSLQYLLRTYPNRRRIIALNICNCLRISGEKKYIKIYI